MKNDHTPRFFESAEALHATGEAMLAGTLPKTSWTHEAHLAVCLWLILERPDIDVDLEIGAIIRRYNRSVGVPNDATQGYHETITRAFLAGARSYLERAKPDSLLAAVNGLLVAPEGARDWPLRFWSRERLFSVQARLDYCPPDLARPELARLIPYLPGNPTPPDQ